MKLRLPAKKIGYRKEFLREILKEVRVRDNAVRLGDKLPMTVRTPLSKDQNPQKEEFFTLYQMMEAAAHCKEPVCTYSLSLSGDGE